MKAVMAALTGGTVRTQADGPVSPVRRARHDEPEVDDGAAASFAGALHAAQQRLDETPARPRVALGSGLDGADAAALRVDRSLDRLSPEFRSRLERVIERMEREFGHEVRLVEGFRAQERQEHLYAQGRTRPGPIVTWTLDSAHTHGRAADLLVDGSYDNPLGYERLARVARQEGLRTLGPFDQGHVELPDIAGDAGGSAREPGAATTAETSTAGPLRPAGPSGTGVGATSAATVTVAQVAPVARVAQVATVAPVARVAQVAAVGASGSVGNSVNGGAADAALHTRAAGETGAGGSSRAGGRRGATDESSSKRGRGPYAVELDAWSAADAAGRTGSGGRTPAVIDGEGVLGAAAAERVARIAELQDAADARPLSRITLRLDDVDGGPGRIRIDLRGSGVDADIAVADAGEAARLAGNTRELQQALQREGLVLEGLRAHTTAADGAETLRPGIATAHADAGVSSGSSAAESERERHGGDDAREAPHRDPDTGRRHPSRDHNGRGHS